MSGKLLLLFGAIAFLIGAVVGTFTPSDSPLRRIEWQNLGLSLVTFSFWLGH